MILHVACLPFPSYQGTQAALDAMLRVSFESGRQAELLVYAHGAYAPEASYRVHRIGDFPKVRSLRSGPSLGKLALDARCITETRRLVRRLRPRAVVAHHIEAAAAALAAQVRPLYYVAHTCLGRELPTYFPTLPTRMVSAVAARSEQFILERVDGAAAVAPALVDLLGGEKVQYLPVPWRKATVDERLGRVRAREALGLPPESRICLYAGNLDRYQGWEHLLEALVVLRSTHRTASLLVATESDAAPVLHEAHRLRIADSVHVRRLDGEVARALAHAASDLTWIPRRIEGGLPIKMLDAFARGLPVIAMARATAGLSIHGACRVVATADPTALAAAARTLIDEPQAAEALRNRAFRYLANHHGEASFATAIDVLLDGEPRPSPTLRAPHPAALSAPRARSAHASRTNDMRRALRKAPPRLVDDRRERR